MVGPASPHALSRSGKLVFTRPGGHRVANPNVQGQTFEGRKEGVDPTSGGCGGPPPSGQWVVAKWQCCSNVTSASQHFGVFQRGWKYALLHETS